MPVRVRHDPPEPFVEVEPLLSDDGQRFLDGALSAHDYVNFRQIRAEEEQAEHPGESLSKGEFLRVLSAVVSLAYSITALVFLSTQSAQSAVIAFILSGMTMAPLFLIFRPRRYFVRK